MKECPHCGQSIKDEKDEDDTKKMASGEDKSPETGEDSPSAKKALDVLVQAVLSEMKKNSKGA